MLSMNFHVLGLGRVTEHKLPFRVVFEFFFCNLGTTVFDIGL